MLGVMFDTELYMAETIITLSEEANWKVRTLLRTNRFYDKGEILNLYKTRVLGYIEYRTATIYHCAENLLHQLDAVQQRVCNAVNVTSEEALLSYNLAPLIARRDMAMLGLIHRTVIGLGPEQFKKYFVIMQTPGRPEGREALRRHDKQLRSYRKGKFLQIVSHSIFGLVDIYNLLPEYTVMAPTVKIFQHRLQEQMISAVMMGMTDWSTMYSPRKPIFCHVLRTWQKWEGTGISPDWLK